MSQLLAGIAPFEHGLPDTWWSVWWIFNLVFYVVVLWWWTYSGIRRDRETVEELVEDPIGKPMPPRALHHENTEI